MLGGVVLFKVFVCIVLLLVFVGLFEMFGFIFSVVLVGFCMVIFYGVWLIFVVVIVSLFGIGFYWLFDCVLDVLLLLGVFDFLLL